jgi:hypothetical protein
MDHLRANGFRVKPVQDRNYAAVRRRYGVADTLASCHTALIEGYIVEGHVPAREIHRLLAERPRARGLSVPGMPVGSPGMEQGERREAYEVLLLQHDGTPSVYARYPATSNLSGSRRPR